MAKGTINVNQNNNRVILQDQNPKITITDNVQNKTVIIDGKKFYQKIFLIN